MAHPIELMEALVYSLEDDPDFPDNIEYILEEPDTTGEHAGTDLPAVTIQPITNVRLDPHNTDFDGYVTDDNGNHIGRIYRAEYRLDLQIDIWTVAGSEYDPDTLGNKLRNRLYIHDSSGLGLALPKNEQGESLTDVWRFRVADGERADDLTTDETIRRYRQDVAIWSYEEFRTTDDYITSVTFPTDASDSDDDDMIEIT